MRMLGFPSPKRALVKPLGPQSRLPKRRGKSFSRTAQPSRHLFCRGPEPDVDLDLCNLPSPWSTGKAEEGTELVSYITGTGGSAGVSPEQAKDGSLMKPAGLPHQMRAR